VELSPNCAFPPSQHKYHKLKLAQMSIMAIYFLTDNGAVEKREFTCLFCNVAFDERKTLNQHYLEAHPSAFSTEKMITASARRPYVV
jgi:hypothetical protein